MKRIILVMIILFMPLFAFGTNKLNSGNLCIGVEQRDSLFTIFQQKSKQYSEDTVKSQYETLSEYKKRLSAVNKIDTNLYYLDITYKATKYNAENKLFKMYFAGTYNVDYDTDDLRPIVEKSFDFWAFDIEYEKKITNTAGFTVNGTVNCGTWFQLFIKNFDKISPKYIDTSVVRDFIGQDLLSLLFIKTKIDAKLAQKIAEDRTIYFLIGIKNIDFSTYTSEVTTNEKPKLGEKTAYIILSDSLQVDIKEIVVYDSKTNTVLFQEIFK